MGTSVRATDSLPSTGSSVFNLKFILIFCVAAITFICYSQTLQNEFTDWDDGIYLVNNPYVKNLTTENVKMILFHNITDNYYHPLTMLSLAINYHFSKLQPFWYYFTNVILHVLNTCLVFLLLFSLLNAMERKGYKVMQGKEWMAAVGALLFGIHPMHVESVSWLSERKDVLYCLFYFLGLLTYVKYVDQKNIKWMVCAMVFYLCSMASKPSAIVFPFSLLALDFLLKRKIGKNVLLEKVPIIIVTLMGGWWAWYAQNAGGAVVQQQVFTFFQRVLFACNNFMMYCFNAFVPIKLSPFYPFPASGDDLSALFYLSPFIDIAIIVLPLYFSYKAGRDNFRVVIFGFVFFFFNIVYLLQFIHFGRTIRSDRYTYVPYFGIFFMLIWFVQYKWQKVSFRNAIKVGLSLFICFFGYQCYSRTKVWHSSETLWSDVIDKYPRKVELAYNSLGDYYFDKGETDKAFSLYKIAVDMQTSDPRVYTNLGNIYAKRKQLNESIAAYNEALKLDDKDYLTYLNMGITYSSVGRYDSAQAEYEHAYQLNPTSEKVLHALALNALSSGHYNMAITGYIKLIQVNPNVSQYYEELGIAYGNAGNYPDAIKSFKYSLDLDPANGSCMFNISVLYQKMNDRPNALIFALKARQAGYQVADSYISSLQ